MAYFIACVVLMSALTWWMARDHYRGRNFADQLLAERADGRVRELQSRLDDALIGRVDTLMKMEQEQKKNEFKVAGLMTQVQTMAERLASLKLETRTDGSVVVQPNDIPFTPEKFEDRPYSPALFQFCQALEAEDIRLIVEDYIEIQRSAGRDDEQILDQLNRGEYVDG